MDKKICVIGLGYIGLPTAVLLANNSYKVYGFDIVQKTVDTINKGQAHIAEPKLDELVKKAVKSKMLIASTKPKEADIFIIAVPTPFKREEEPKPDISYIISALKNIKPYLKKDNLIILESTSPVGTTDKIANILKDVKGIKIAYCPERVLPGNIIYELIHNDRIVGGIDEDSTNTAYEFYKNFVKGEVLKTNAKTAELAKLTENSYRDVNIAFANELSLISDKLGINVRELIKLCNRHPRVNILNPSSGVGGHCIAVDPWFIISSVKNEARLIKKAREVNDYKPLWIVEKIKNKVSSFKGGNPKIACMGLSFKADIDDLRESPALFITNTLIKEGLDIFAVEPNIKEYKNFKITTYKEAIEKCDIIVFLVAHKEFKNLDLGDKEVLDFCGLSN